MKVVLFSRVPRWYSFKNERLASKLTAQGCEVVGVVVEETSTIGSLSEWTKKLGWQVFFSKLKQKLVGKKENPPTKNNSQSFLRLLCFFAAIFSHRSKRARLSR